MGFSVEEWQRADDRLTIVVIDLSESTNSAIPGGSSVLEHSKSYICSLAPAIARGRYVIIGCSTRCEKCDVFCECPSSGNTRILLRSDKKGSPPNRIREVIKPLQPQGATYIAKPIAMLQRIAMSEFELEQRQRVTTQRTAFFMGAHRRLGEASIVRRLPQDLMWRIGLHVGTTAIHCRVIMVMDGDNNQSCGDAACTACSSWNGPEPSFGRSGCRFDGPEGVTHAVQDLLQASAGIKMNLELNVALVGNGQADRKQLNDLCAATGGRFDAVRDANSSFLAESFRFFDRTARNQSEHVGVRRQAVSTYVQRLREGTSMDVGVKTVWTGKDKEVVEQLDAKEAKSRAQDAERQALCEAAFGCATPHGNDRAACLNAIRAQLYEDAHPTEHKKVDTAVKKGAATPISHVHHA